MEKPAQEAPKSLKGKKNIYTCDRCAGHIVTVDVDDGVTPFMIACEVTEKCHGMMRSSMYRVFDQSMKASHEWYRPSPATGGNLSAGALDHVMKGGLLLRRAKRMGKGIETAATDAPEHAAVMNELKEQLLIVFLRRLGREVNIPVDELDDTGGETMAFSLNDGVFHFVLKKKN